MNAKYIETMKQIGLDLSLSVKMTRKREFLGQMDRVVPWAALVQIAQPHSLRAKTGRQPFAIETMLRIHYFQQWYGLSDPAMEEALHDVPLHREVVGRGDGANRLPDETTIVRFRHLLEAYGLAADMLHVVNDILQAKGMLLRAGTAVDATLIAAPSSTKNASGERDSAMKQTKKGSQWYFGIAPVEAQACGTPVIAFGRGGALETVVGSGAQRTGTFSATQSAGAIVAAVNEFSRAISNVRPRDYRRQAGRFSEPVFRRNVRDGVNALLARSRTAADGLVDR